GRERRVEQVLDDALRGSEQAAGRVEFDHERAGMMRAGVPDGVLDKPGDGRIDRAVDLYQANPRRSRGCGRRGCRGGTGKWRTARLMRGAVVLGGCTSEAAER